MNKQLRIYQVFRLIFFLALIFIFLSPTRLSYAKAVEESDQRYDFTDYIDITIHSASLTEDYSPKLYLQGKNAFFFIPSCFTDDELCLVYDENTYEFILSGKTIKSGSVLEDISLEKPYELTLNSSQRGSIDYILQFLSSDEMPALFINTESKTMVSIDSVKGNAESGDMTCLLPNGQTDAKGELDRLFSRGNSSFRPAKKSYGMYLKEEQDLLSMGAAKKWILIANAHDASKMRNVISYGLAKAMELPFAVDCEFADIYFNNEYWGTYLICEHIEVGKNRVELEPSVTSRGFLLESITGERLIKAQDNSFGETDIPADEARELLKNYDISNYFEVKDGTYFEVKYPEEAYDADVKHAEEIILRAEELIDNCKTHDDYIKLKDYIDTDSFATMYLMNLITGDHDANKYSTYYWIDSKTEKLYAGPAWDYDKCLGDEPLLDGYVNFFSYYKGYPERLADNEFFIQDVKAKLLSQAMPYLNGLLDGEIDRLKAHLAPSVKMDKIIWGDTVYHTNVDTGNYEESVKYLSYVIKNKGSFIEEAITNKDAYHTVYIDDNYHGRFCLIKDGECMPLELIENLKKVYGCTSFTFVNDAPFWEGYPIYYDLVIYTKGSSSSGTTTKINAPTNGADQNNNTITDNESNDTPYNSITLIDGSQFNFIAMLILLIFGLFTAMFLIFHALRKRSRRRKDSTK